MIKTQTKEECQFMKKILPHYYKYMSENPSTQLVKIFGMHRVKMYHLNRKIHFVIMESVFDTTDVIHQIFDLKGSLVGRSATESERAKGGVLKDNDLVNGKVKFHLGENKAPFIEQIQKDAQFLATLNIMDYSLLVSII
jgi:1-phosphatidylinositol-4-phosphate 5-kinase